MKKIFKTLLPGFVLALAFTACDDEMGSKESIDSKYESSIVTDSATIVSVTVNGYEGFTVKGTVSDTTLLEAGISYSLTEDFANETLLAAQSIASDSTFEVTANVTKDNTLYYVRAYAYSRNGNITYSEKTFTAQVEKAPAFEDTYLIGEYTAADYDLTTGEIDGGYYDMTIEQYNGQWNRVAIYNLWGGDLTIYGTVDFENKTIVTDPQSVVYVHSSYGNVWAEGLVITEEGGLGYYSDNNQMLFDYDEEGNVVGLWGARCSAGFFGYYQTVIQKN